MYKSQLNSPWDDSNLEPIGCVRSVAALALLQGHLLAAHFDGNHWTLLGHDNKWHSIPVILDMVAAIEDPQGRNDCVRQQDWSFRSKTFAATLYLLQATEDYYSDLPKKVVPLPPLIDYCYWGM